MNYKKAWQTVLGQLEMEMPRASYETWLRDTEALSYEDGCLRVGVRTAYARDWLEDRLASTVSRLLIGIMNRTVRVDFVVATQEVDEEEEEENLEEATGGRGLVIDSASSTRYEEEVKLGLHNKKTKKKKTAKKKAVASDSATQQSLL